MNCCPLWCGGYAWSVLYCESFYCVVPILGMCLPLYHHIVTYLCDCKKDLDWIFDLLTTYRSYYKQLYPTTNSFQIIFKL
jgi:hypothetical protein